MAQQNDVTLSSFSKNHIDVIVTPQAGTTYRLTGIYGEPDRSKRKETWSLIRNLASQTSLPWCLVGDMNNVLSQQDKRGGRPYPNHLLQGFQSVLTDCDLTDMNLCGHQFTWDRGVGTVNHIEVRLDRALVNPAFLNAFQEARLTNLEISTSDHCPILLEPNISNFTGKSRSFRFENAWLREPMFYQIVEDTWSSNTGTLFDKLSSCADILSVWGKEITGNFKGRINQSKRVLKTLKGRRDSYSLNLYQEEKKKLNETYAQQEVFWRQRSKQLWLREGDQNSKYFHSATKIRRRMNQIDFLYDDQNNKAKWGSGLELVVESYFSNIFNSSSSEWDQVIGCISRKVSTRQNEAILAEVRKKK